MKCARHNVEFDPLEGGGCPQCIAKAQTARDVANAPVSTAMDEYEARLSEDALQSPLSIVKVQYYSETTGKLSEREYSYYTEEPLAVGDIVMVPAKWGDAKAKVSAIDVPCAEIEAFKDKVKTIPAGSIVKTDTEKAWSAMVEATEPIPGCLPDNIGEPITITESLLKESAPETALALRPGADAEAMSWHVQALNALAYANARKVTNAEEHALASDDLSLISKLKKLMEARRKELLDPLKAQSDAIRETYTFIMGPVIEADQITRAKMTAYLTEQARIKAEQERINQQRMEAAEAEMALKGELTAPLDLMEVMPEAPKSIKTALGSSGLTDHWTFEITNLDLIPREYMMADTVLLGNTAKKYHDKKEVPGVRFVNKPFMSNRAR